MFISERISVHICTDVGANISYFGGMSSYFKVFFSYEGVYFVWGQEGARFKSGPPIEKKLVGDE